MEENPNPVNREQNDTSPQSKNQLQTPAPKKPNGRRNRLLPALLAVIGAALLGYCAWTFLFAGQGASAPAPSSEAPSVSASEPEPEPGSSESEPADPLAPYREQVYPVGKLVGTHGRSAYVDKSMVLRVPRLNLVSEVRGGSDDETLKGGVGLYEYGQVPGEGNPNVSIAGHRDIYGCEFLDIQTVTDGDLMYLDYEGKEYVYEYEGTEIIQADDWDPIRIKDYNRLTLTSCDPIGTHLNRIVVTGRLIAVNDLPEEPAPSVSGESETLETSGAPAELSAPETMTEGQT